MESCREVNACTRPKGFSERPKITIGDLMAGRRLASIAYTFERSLYVSLTNRINSVSLSGSCGPGFALPPSSGFEPLPTGFEPSPEEVAEAVAHELSQAAEPPKKVVFAGAGEPLLRRCELEETAALLTTQHPNLPLRLNTNGLIPASEASDLASRLRTAGLASVSCNIVTADPKQYAAHMKPEPLRYSPAFQLDLGHDEVKSFAIACVAAGLDVECTAVGAPGVDVGAVSALAAEIGASFRVREWFP